MIDECYSLWLKYGLSIDLAITGSDYTNARIAHNKVVKYLELHSDVSKRYLDETDNMKYLDVLFLAEREISL